MPFSSAISCCALVLAASWHTAIAARVCASSPFDNSIITSGGTPPACTIACLHSLARARSPKAAAACTWEVLTLRPSPRSRTRGMMAPACAMTVRFSEERLASFASDSADFICAAAFRTSSKPTSELTTATRFSCATAMLSNAPRAYSWLSSLSLPSKAARAGIAPTLASSSWFSTQSCESASRAAAAHLDRSTSAARFATRGGKHPSPAIAN